MSGAKKFRQKSFTDQRGKKTIWPPPPFFFGGYLKIVGDR